MRERPTARVLLFDRDDRLLLIKGRLPSAAAGVSSWYTVGGGVEPGESLAQAALREVGEEAGIFQVDLGPVVWRRESVLVLADGLPSLLRESYFVARCDGGEPDRSGWDAQERRLCDDIRWWRHEELRAVEEPIYPERLLELLPAILKGNFPAEPVDITVAR